MIRLAKLGVFPGGIVNCEDLGDHEEQSCFPSYEILKTRLLAMCAMCVYSEVTAATRGVMLMRSHEISQGMREKRRG